MQKAVQKLFSPIKVGPLNLSHRVVMAPLTRLRSEQPGDIPGDLMAEYYGQRASKGGLIISEGTTVSITGRGYLGVEEFRSGSERAKAAGFDGVEHHGANADQAFPA